MLQPPRIVTAERAVFARLADGDGVIVDTETAFYFALNGTAAFLWQKVQASGEVTAAQLVAALCEKFEVGEQQANRDVAQFLERLLEHGLIARVNESPDSGNLDKGEHP